MTARRWFERSRVDHKVREEGSKIFSLGRTSFSGSTRYQGAGSSGLSRPVSDTRTST